MINSKQSNPQSGQVNKISLPPLKKRTGSYYACKAYKAKAHGLSIQLATSICLGTFLTGSLKTREKKNEGKKRINSRKQHPFNTLRALLLFGPSLPEGERRRVNAVKVLFAGYMLVKCLPHL